ncbi:TetR/AcrR family transcriptional regulator [Rhizobium skierniewicense]|uniref:TetR/AcrR family transcriptional regulator n=1 Tax=Rhizobium skierniewicense TaxID=984260 RepID=UPI0015716B97|nr:TetR/AcrR family transcriptional regulator [Rhizobium skierniewicense]NTF34823.1 TetR/AcrR family transcriptional regulator [Rhizobium skierniewicense]
MKPVNKPHDAEPGNEANEPIRVGRKRDHTRDTDLLEAAIMVLAETGYDRMTMDMVAARAKAGKATMYRRWSSKPELVLEAIAHMKRDQVDLTSLPDTGTLRGDLLGLFKPKSVEESELKMKALSGLSSMLAQHQELADATNAVIVEPWTSVNRVLIQRAVDRGEISPDIDIETLAQVIPSMSAYRTVILRKSVDQQFLTAMIDNVLLPALMKPTRT